MTEMNTNCMIKPTFLLNCTFNLKLYVKTKLQCVLMVNRD